MPSGRSRLSQLILLMDSLTATLVWESPGTMCLPFPSAEVAVQQVLALL
jgi:hypothetical protein